jgi:hypothetical protein
MPNSVGDWQDDAFIGMWQDREDLADSSAWVRSVREAGLQLLPYP